MLKHNGDRRPGRSALALSVLLLVAACAAAPEGRVGAPRSGSGVPVDPVYGTPLPGSAPIGGG